MKVLKRNQIVVFVIALMLVTAGYLNFTTNNINNDSEQVSTMAVENELNVATTSNTTNDVNIGEAKLVSGNVVNENEDKKEERKEENKEKETSAKTENDDYFSSSKLQRDVVYSQTIESYQKILDSTSISNEQKAIAQNEISKINEIKNAIMISENLIKTKGIEDVVIFVNDSSISVILKGSEVQPEIIAQVQNIVSRELKTEIENIHISNK